MLSKKSVPGKRAASKAAVPHKEAGSGPQLTAASLEDSVGYALRRAQLSTYSAFFETMQQFDIRPSQFAVLALIGSNPGQTQTAISAELGIQKTNFVALLDKLEERDLVERRKVGGDRRYSALYLTEAGEALMQLIEVAHASMEKKLAQRLGAKRTRELLTLLHEFTGKA